MSAAVPARHPERSILATVRADVLTPGVLAACCLAGACFGARHAAAAESGPRCTGTDDRLRPLPPGWVAAAQAVFGLSAAPPEMVGRGTVWRCEEERAMACFVGANLPCGKLDRRAVIPAIARWCRGRPDGLVPADVSGHATVWRWACSAGRALHSGVAWQADGRGFARETWKPLEVPHD